MAKGGLRRRIRPSGRVLGALVLLGLVAGAFSGIDPGAQGAVSNCGKAILRDWRADGAVGREYEAECYLEAIDALPEDARTYTSAEDDITRALQVHVDEATDASDATAAAAQRVSSADAPPGPTASGSLRLPPLPVLVLVGVGVVLFAGALALAVPSSNRRR